jgi:hypothetical protein
LDSVGWSAIEGRRQPVTATNPLVWFGSVFLGVVLLAIADDLIF